MGTRFAYSYDMRLLPILSVLLAPAVLLSAQNASPPASRTQGKTLSASSGAPAPPLSTPGPLFVTQQSALQKPIKIVAYGDMRFTNPSETTATNPVARRDLVAKIAQEEPDAILISGDIPWRGNVVDDYTWFRTETAVWRTENLRVYPALGNHEFSKCEPAVCLEHWWNAFPEMPQLRGRRWYSAQLGDAIYILSIDSDTSLLPGSEQRVWLEAQIAQLPKSIRFVLITMHHPPVGDIQAREHVDHNPRPNEIALVDLLRNEELTTRARFVVIAGHTHNYERFLEDGVMYFVSGGGGAQPYHVDRSPSDLYQDPSFPNYHYLRFTLQGKTLKGEMVRLKDASAATPEWEVKDKFEIKAK
jgi:hypothetical protein